MGKTDMFKISTFLMIILLSAIPFNLFAQEQISITTYYPSPVGSYAQLRANRMVIGPTRAMPTTDGQLFWGTFSNRGILRSDATNGATIELGGNNNPYIDFSNDNTAGNDFDARVQLQSDTIFRIYADNIQYRNRANNDFADAYVRDIYLCHP